MEYSDFDYLCNEPYYIEGIGNVKNPTLRDIRKITYGMFSAFISMCKVTKDDFLREYNLSEQYDALSETEKEYNSVYYLLLYSSPDTLFSFVEFFINDSVDFNNEDNSFVIYKNNGTGEKKNAIGKINNDNFDIFRNSILLELGLKPIETKPIKYKTERARKLAEKIAKAKAMLVAPSKVDANMSLENRIRKYCTYNKVGINILTVWDMTFYQFNEMFSEYANSRQVTLNDDMAGNSFQFKNTKDYKVNLWIEKLHRNKQ